MIRVYGLRQNLDPIKAKLSDVINGCMVDALSFPTDKRAHRFIPMDAEDFYYPEGRTDAYTVIEISLMEGTVSRSQEETDPPFVQAHRGEFGGLHRLI